jgi:transposase
MAAALEVPHGALVETLLAHGFRVFSINPKQLDRFRDRYTVGGAKDDRRDAFVLAASMITDIDAYREVKSESSFVVRVRELSRTMNEFEKEHRRYCNQLRDLLFRSFPAILRLSPAADEPWIWDLLSHAPCPSKVARLRTAQINKILKAHRIRRIEANRVSEELRSKALGLTTGTSESIAEHVCLLLPVLRVLQEQRKKISETLSNLIKEASKDINRPEHTTVQLMCSLPGVGVMVATTLLAEANAALVDCDYRRLRCYAGTAPVTKQSGKNRRVLMRHGCNHRVREACYHWARVSVQRDVVSRSHYQRLRKAGHGHGRALRGVCDRLLCVLLAMLRTGEPYCVERRLTRCTSLTPA